MDINSYIHERLNPQIIWYDKNSQQCQKKYKLIQIIEITLAAIIPFLSGYVSDHWIIPVIIGLIGVSITIMESLTKLNKYHELWIEYRTTCELLKYQKYLFETKSSPYNDGEDTIENIFVSNIEQITSSENNQWKILNIKSKTKEDDNS